MNLLEPRVLSMRRSRIQFSIGSTMAGVAGLGVLTWLMIGVVRYGAGLFTFSPYTWSSPCRFSSRYPSPLW
jgi:hypothetical protein